MGTLPSVLGGVVQSLSVKSQVFANDYANNLHDWRDWSKTTPAVDIWVTLDVKLAAKLPLMGNVELVYVSAGSETVSLYAISNVIDFLAACAEANWCLDAVNSNPRANSNWYFLIGIGN